ncbi:NIPSNAP protein [bacterium A37T11]|nr:NIPSNAP protein [bacterium A37T11]
MIFRYLLLAFFSIYSLTGRAAQGDFYQIKVYHFKNARQEATTDAFLEKAYLPALHRAGIEKVGVFKPVVVPGGPTAEQLLIYVFVPFASPEAFFGLDQQLEKDAIYASDGKEYLDASYIEPPYERIESILLTAFPQNPHFELPNLRSPKAQRVYELRSYEGPTEKLHQNKVTMFDKGDEVGLFKRLGFNAVFYAEVISGSRMPNLMYLTTFENKAERDKHWESFNNDAYWKELSVKPEYQHNVSRNDTKFLYPVEYSDI